MNRKIFVLIMAVLLFASVKVQASIVCVKTTGNDANSGSSWAEAKRTVQAGIDAASSGDEVWVAAGTYVECITIRRKIKLFGGFPANGGAWDSRDAKANATVIDANKAGRVVTIKTVKLTPVTVNGFTIRNGYLFSGPGGGVYSIYAALTLENNTIIDNSVLLGSGGGVCISAAHYYYPTTPNVISGNIVMRNTAWGGSGIFSQGGSIAITNNIISDNGSPTNPVSIYGGGIYVVNSIDSTIHGLAIISGNTITDNDAICGAGVALMNSFELTYLSDNTIKHNATVNKTASYGGGVYAFGGYPTISGNTITENASILYGGGIYTECTAPKIIHNVIEDNSCSATGGLPISGGGIYCLGNGYIAENTIRRNYASVYGGGIRCVWTSNISVSSNILEGNSAGVSGGGIQCSYRSAVGGYIVNGNTVVKNTAPDGGGISFADVSVIVTNNIVAFNSSGFCLYNSVSGITPIFSNNCVYNPDGADYTKAAGVIPSIGPGRGDVLVEPMFVDKDAGNYHLLPNSPCINAGINGAPGLSEFDIDGQGRICWETVDIGADEYWPIPVQIDIKPGENPNNINPKSNGKIAVAILSNNGFDATSIDPSSIVLAGAKVALVGKGNQLAQAQDIDGDGDLDLLLYFQTQSLNLSSKLTLIGRIGNGGDWIEGSDSVVLAK